MDMAVASTNSWLYLSTPPGCSHDEHFLSTGDSYKSKGLSRKIRMAVFARMSGFC